MSILDKFKLDGKTAIVTGCGRGLGQGIALALAEAGANVYGVGKAPHADKTAKLIAGTGKQFEYLSANLIFQNSVGRIFNEALKISGSVDILVNNAGIIRRNDSVDFTETDWDDVININLKTLFFMSQEAARQFIKQGTGGKIVNIASMRPSREASGYRPIQQRRVGSELLPC
jgi:2-deoxy-D-gluconate 3-dehydrogenase